MAQDLLERMARNGADFTLTFRRLADAQARTDGDAAVRGLFSDPSAFDDWANRWRERLACDGEATSERRRAAMRAVNPAFIPRNHLVEEALSAAGDLSAFETLRRCCCVLMTNSQIGHATPIHRGRIRSCAKPFCGT